ncbi:MAG TPA: TetR/AcrR family transcriptional regulator [Candidatus Coprenecus stercoravium]|uniref:TetR/AcrR family transcriptional regulator n=1 Tax=Candidatus Coprenecus stercoravium TaxID=2840735 RepID=A0A9D2GQE4_9BACT|nr:TetR/AcrR family transcriptional regulator [Candidatus Coprenecus stercoravium]
MNSREQILRRTGALFLEHGCKSLTMDEVASANGMSKRTLYEMFRDKAELLQECILLIHKDNMLRTEEDISGTDNVLEWFIRSLENKDEQRMSFYYDFFTQVKRYYPEVFTAVVMDVNRWHCELLERVIRRGQQEGLFIKDVLDAHQISLQLFELSVAVTDRAVRNYLEIKHDRGSDCLMLFLIRGIATESGRAYIDGYLKNNKSLLR